MSRLRTIKPGFFIDEQLAECDLAARILYAGLWTIADREGRLEDRPRRIKAECLPYDDYDPDVLLDQLARRGFIVRYTIGECRFIAIPSWSKHQHPHVKEPASVIPAPDEHQLSMILAPDEPGSSCLLSLGSCLGSEKEKEQDLLSNSGESDERLPARSDDFVPFWSAYPRREGKKNARTAWSHITKEEKRLATGIASVLAKIVEQGVVELRYVPMPTTFIHGKRWEDWRDGIPAAYLPDTGNGKAAAARLEHDAFLRQFAAERGLEYDPEESS